MPEPFDVVVVGAGPAGSSTACHLAGAGRRVLLVEKVAFPRDKACGDGLTRSSVQLLGELGLGERIATCHRVAGVRVSTDANGQRDRLYRPFGDAGVDYGVVIPRRELDELVCRKAVDAGAVLWERTAATALTVDRGRVTGVALRSGQVERQVSASFVVVANGGGSALTRAIGGATRDRWSMGFAVRGYFGDIDPVEDLFHVHVPLVDPRGNRMLAGYGWVFPMGGTTANIGVGYFPTQQEDLSVNLREVFEAFVAGLRRRDRRFARMRLAGRLQGAPLRCGMDHAGCAEAGVLLAGDAAGLVDPFTGEGIDSALESGRLAAQVLDAALASPHPRESDLREYPRLLERRFDDRFRAGRRFLKSYGFMWKLLGNTLQIRRPLFEHVRSALIDYGEAPAHEDDAFVAVRRVLAASGLEDDFDAVLDRLDSTLGSEFPALSRAVARTAGPGDLLVRAALVLLCARYREARPGGRVAAAVCIELAAFALLLHDNLLRGQAGVRWANMFTLMTGNHLLAMSHQLATTLGGDLTASLSRTCALVYAGRIRERGAGATAWSAERYVRNVADGIALLYEAACRVGATLAGSPQPLVDALGDFGRNLGVVAALGSELAAAAAEPSSAGDHPLAAVVSDGELSYPLLHALGTPLGGEVRELLRSGGGDDAAAGRLAAILREAGSLQATRDKAVEFVERARRALAAVPAGQLPEHLAAIADLPLRTVMPDGGL
jgi:geranylgeranyl reductase family protein